MKLNPRITAYAKNHTENDPNYYTPYGMVYMSTRTSDRILGAGAMKQTRPHQEKKEIRSQFQKNKVFLAKKSFSPEGKNVHVFLR